MIRRSALLIGLFVGLLSHEALAQQAIQLSGVPEQLSLPIPAGRNVVVTAEVEGAEPRAVWLAHDREARLRCLLARVGAGRYQMNLADADVAAVLECGGDSFQVFAELPDGTVISSVTVHYAAAPRLHGPPRVYLVRDGRRIEMTGNLPANPFWEPALKARLTGQSVVFSGEGFAELKEADEAGRAYWCAPESAQRIEIEFPEKAARSAVEARAGDKSWAADAAGHAGGWTLPITEEIRRQWDGKGALELLCTEAGQEVSRVRFRAPPSRLDLKGDRAELTITQRTSKPVPGSGGYAAIYLDDITGGQVRLSLGTADGERLIDGRSVRPAETLTFATRDALYVLTLAKLVNYIVGDDYAVLAVARASPEMEAAEQARIRDLLAALAKEHAVFLDGAQEHTAAQMAVALLERLEKGAAKAPTLEQFIARFASRSPATGAEYEVRGPGGERTRARTWLDSLSARVPASAAKAPEAEQRAHAWAEAIEKPGLPNLHRVTKTIYRGAQPTAEGIRELKAMGVKTVINLRSMHSDKDMLEGTGLGYVAISSHAWHPEEEDVVEFLEAVSDESKGPFFVHCHHGADRTGMMIASYRVVVEGWTKEEAIEEMTRGGFGFHSIWSDIVTFVRDLDVEAVRKKAGLPAPVPTR